MSEKFSHGHQFTGYMEVIYRLICSLKDKKKILDIPAGNGLLGEKLKSEGHEVVCADINRFNKEFVFADMSRPLPFKDNEFDIVICMEGIEHVLEPVKLVEELCRICKISGQIFITTPNIQNMYSRFQFMCTGTFYQFPPILPARIPQNEIVDLGHISPFSFMQLQYLFSYFGAKLVHIDGDRYKRKALIPFLFFFNIFGYFWIKLFKDSNLETNTLASKAELKWLFSPPLLFSRSMILVFEKKRV